MRTSRLSATDPALSPLLWAAAAAPGCGAEPDQDALDAIDDGAPADGKDDSYAANAGYYRVTRRDLYRKCAAPMCGGVFVARVNRPSTRCADGVYRAECYVWQIDLAKLALDAASATRLSEAAGAGRALVRGEFSTSGTTTVPNLVATEG